MEDQKPELPNFVTLVSASGHRFVIPESAARGSVTLKDTLEGEMEALETTTKTVTYDQFGPEVIDKLCEYLVFKDFWTTAPNVTTVPDFYERVPVEIVLELYATLLSDFVRIREAHTVMHRLLAADYLSA